MSHCETPGLTASAPRELPGDELGGGVSATAFSSAELIATLVETSRRQGASGSSTSDGLIAELAAITSALISVRGTVAADEFARFARTRFRDLPVDEDELQATFADATILVTGGTGCVGAAVLSELARLGPRRLASVSRGLTPVPLLGSPVDYHFADVRDAQALARVVDLVRPSVVFHLAAQRDPGGAEAKVRETIETNVLGTVNVAAICRRYGVQRLVYASTGKAMRPFTRDVYAASKKVGEWVMAGQPAQGGLVVSAARFTHIVDNSIIRRRICQWIAAEQPVRLHGPAVDFYIQSARESAQLLLSSVLEAESHPRDLALSVIRDLGAPVSLLDLALGANVALGKVVPVQIVGFEPGYEARPYPGLYDPVLSAEFSPLVSALESGMTEHGAFSPAIDVVRMAGHYDDPQALADLQAAIARDSSQLVAHLERLSWTLLRKGLRRVPIDQRERISATASRETAPSDEHQAITALIAGTPRVSRRAAVEMARG